MKSNIKVAVFILLAFALTTQAEPIIIPIASQGLDKSIETPKRGEKTEAIRKQYGEPQSISGPNGEPPITQWKYKTFSVYFEGDTVIHSVLKHQPTTKP
jgi:hypothetical protein